MGKWNLEQVPFQEGKIAVVTGANSGIGYQTCLQLARKGMRIVMACRNSEAGEDAQSSILGIYPSADLEVIEVDLSSLRSVKEFSKKFKSNYQKLDLLVNNAGIMMTPHEVTEDEFEKQMATNYLGHFSLTGLLLEGLKNGTDARVISLSSLSYKWAEINFEDIHFENEYSKSKAYGQSKRACLVFAYELQRRFSKAGLAIKSVAAHPGLSKTNLDRHFPKLIRPLGALFLQKPEKGALPVLYAALSQDIRGGEFIGPDGFQEMRGYPTEVDSDASSKDVSIAEKLWELSEDMTNTRYL